MGAQATIILGGTTLKTVHQNTKDGPAMAHILESRMCPRQIELQAEGRVLLSTHTALDLFEKRILILERIAFNPDAYPDYPDRPKRPLRNASLWSWIAKRIGAKGSGDGRYKPEEIREALDRAGVMYQKLVTAGIDPLTLPV